ncbi:MAG: L-threonylcarbamoyladenylate synthase [Bacteroidota bacterium]
MIGSDIDHAVELLEQNLPVAIPTETVYGLAANALNEDAIVSVFKAKHRPFFDPLILHVVSILDARNYVETINETAMKLAEKFWPGPLTLLLKKKANIPYIATAGSDYVAVRVPNHPMALSLLSQLEFPLVAPSANPFGYISPTTAEHVEKQLGDKIPYILDGDECAVGIESTIVDCTTDDVIILRLGGLPIADIEAVIGKKVVLNLSQNSNPSAPGQLDRHYAPSKPFIIADNILQTIQHHEGKKIGVLSFGHVSLPDQVLNYNLSVEGNLEEAAKNLFNMMHLLDNSDCEIIITKFVPVEGLGMAINDRLLRAGK